MVDSGRRMMTGTMMSVKRSTFNIQSLDRAGFGADNPCGAHYRQLLAAVTSRTHCGLLYEHYSYPIFTGH